MAPTCRSGMSNEQKNKAWKLWRAGESFSEIGRQLGRAPGAIFCYFQYTEAFFLIHEQGRHSAFCFQNVRRFQRASF